MRIDYPTASAESGQKGLLGRAQKPSAAAGSPIDFQQAAQFELLPQRRAQQGKEITALMRNEWKPMSAIGDQMFGKNRVTSRGRCLTHR